ncbi:MAG: rhodanese-like domain-containing protein [Bacteroidota bacterium]
MKAPCFNVTLVTTGLIHLYDFYQKYNIMGFLSFLFGSKTNKVSDYISKGAILLDVRTDSEYQNKHIEGSIHIPLQQLKQRVDEVKQLNQPIIAFCASGVRSEKATRFLKTEGVDCINGGGINTIIQALKQ